MIEIPKFIHDCYMCQFVGRHKGQDLYTHKGSKPTYLLRYGDDGQDYVSGKTFLRTEPQLYEKTKELSSKRVRYNWLTEYDPLDDTECCVKGALSRVDEDDEYTARDIRNWQYVEGVFEELGPSSSTFRELWIKVHWLTPPKKLMELERWLESGLPAHTKAYIVRFTWKVPKDAMHAYDH